MPTDASKWLDKQKSISPYRAVRKISIHRQVPDPLPNVTGLTSTIESKIGGLMGLGGDPCLTSVTFERNQYYGGDKVTVRIDCDNSKCSTAVKSFKLKFKRKVFMVGERKDHNNALVRTLNK